MKRIVLLSPALILPVALFVLFGPGFLFVENIPRQADAVVLFVGPGNLNRFEEARQLVREGYGRYLLVPSTGEIFPRNDRGEPRRLSQPRSGRDLALRLRIAADYGKYYENTHIEALEAKRMMDDLGLRSAMLVSSGFHMRRIGLIAGRVFDDRTYSVSCNPARWQVPFTPRDWFDRERRGRIVSEYVKMGWFLLYGMFV